MILEREREEREKERDKERESERERDLCVRETWMGCLPYVPNANRNLGMCPDWGWNPQPLVYRVTFQPTEPPGQGLFCLSILFEQY